MKWLTKMQLNNWIRIQFKAYCERIFSVCADILIIFAARRNHMLKVNLDQQVFLKMNYNTSDITQLLTAHSDQRTLAGNISGLNWSQSINQSIKQNFLE